MKVYFVGSPKGKPSYEEEYRKIYQEIESLGHKHLTDLTVRVDPDKHYNLDNSKLVEHYKETIRYIREADVIVVESSTPTMAMGYIVVKALDILKPVIVLHTKGREPFFISGLEDDRLQIIEYSTQDLKQQLSSAFDYAQEQMETRFNFFIAPKHSRYLDWVAKKARIPRAVHLRRLLEKDMETNRQYLKESIKGK